MNLFATKITKYFEQQNLISDSQRELFQFTVEGLMHDTLIFLICICIGIYSGLPFENFIFLSTYSLLRQYAGGIHAKTRNQCLVFTCILCYICIMVIKLFPPELTCVFCIPSFSILSYSTPCTSSINPRTIRQKYNAHINCKKTIYFLTVISFLGMILHCSNIYVPIFTAFGAVSILVLVSTDNIKKKVLLYHLKPISSVILSLGLVMVQTRCPHWLYEPNISDSLRRYVDNL